MNITKAENKDIAEILLLLNEAKGNTLTEEQKAEQGFVQGNLNESLLLKSKTGIFIAKKNNIITGTAATFACTDIDNGPATEMYKNILKNSDYSINDIFLYGPVTVKNEYRGKGILTELLKYVCIEFKDKYKIGAAFVEEANKKSLSIHRHYPMTEFGTFIFNDKKYFIFSFKPSKIIKFYKKN